MKQPMPGRGGVCAALVLPALAVGLALVLGLPSTATALVTQERSITIRTGGTGGGGMSMNCRLRDGRRAISGGFAAPGFDPSGRGPRILTRTSYLLGPAIPSDEHPENRGTSWWTTPKNDGSRRGTLIGYAYCRKGNPLRPKRGRSVVAPGQQGTASARCPRGMGVISGGYRTDPGMQISESRKTGPRRWTVSAFYPSPWHGEGSAAFLAEAYCGPGQRTENRRSRATFAPGGIGRVTASCRRGERLLSGGFTNPNFQATGGPQMLAHTSRKAGRKQRWTVAAHTSGTRRGALVAVAYCRAR